MHPVIFENTDKYYADKKVLDNVSFSMEENKISVILGRSGSGKSTILKLINGLLKPDSGTVKVFGEKIIHSDIYELRKQIGYSVQGTSLFPHMNVYENITLLGRLNKWNKEKISDRLDILLKFVDLPEKFLKKYPAELSGGEQQRVGICRAMMLNPKIFLLDEAFGALDPTTKSEIHSELLRIQSIEPRTIVIVTHDLQEAFKLADRIIIIEKGVIRQTGVREEILNSEIEFVKYFIRSQIEFLK
ncbi:MAG TPA: ATP-binding cassette domain-containing protein [Ignavibacteria bacterium]|nr:ATP-binding cassette domain-containing protein [Ignavibacteria bacterium]HMR39900.1 ATP-binding cassette domain-containing protein [Ignavibacteria bacterium]